MYIDDLDIQLDDLVSATLIGANTEGAVLPMVVDEKEIEELTKG